MVGFRKDVVKRNKPLIPSLITDIVPDLSESFLFRSDYAYGLKGLDGLSRLLESPVV